MAEQNDLIIRLKELKKDYDERHQYWLSQGLEPQLKDAFLQQSYEPVVNFYAVAFNEFIPAIQQSNKNAAEAALAKMCQDYEQHRKIVEHVVELASERSKADEMHAREKITSANTLLLVMFLGALGAAIIVAATIIRGLLRELGGEPDYAAEITRKIAAGDLTTQVALKEQDQHSLLYSISRMQDVLRQIVSSIQVAVENVRTGSQQITSGNEDLSSRTEEQASSLEETASALEQLTATVENTAENTRQARSLAAEGTTILQRTMNVMQETTQQMQGIHQSSQKIAAITNIVESIAFQTNILALNAAVEAARAGESGRGFAVVAGEVRSLAQKSATAAKDIKELIEESVSQVQSGRHLIEQASDAMQATKTNATSVGQLINEIAQAAQEQSDGIRQINQAIGQIDTTTQQNATLVQEASTASLAMQEQAMALSSLVAEFKLNDKQSGARSAQLSAHDAISSARSFTPPQSKTPAGDLKCWESF